LTLCSETPSYSSFYFYFYGATMSPNPKESSKSSGTLREAKSRPNVLASKIPIAKAKV